MPHNKANYDACMKTEPEKFAYVQYYDVLGNEDVPSDGVEIMLDCIRLKW